MRRFIVSSKEVKMIITTPNNENLGAVKLSAQTDAFFTECSIKFLDSTFIIKSNGWGRIQKNIMYCYNL
jgi:hypothetical protein